MKNKFIFYFGAPNDAEGNLSKMSKSRADKIIEISKNCDEVRIVLTGGFGHHFNTTKTPHYQYVENYLLENGILSERVVKRLTTNNTVDDVRLIAQYCKKNSISNPILVTSEFHAARSQLLFMEFFSGSFKMEISTTDCTTEEFIELTTHELKSLKKLLVDKKNGHSPRASIPDQI